MIIAWLLIALLTSCFTNREAVPNSDGYLAIVIGRFMFYLAWPLLLVIWFGNRVRDWLLEMRS